MIYPNSDLKFRVWTDYENFSMDEDDFRVRIIDRYGRVRYEVPKDECFLDSEGHWYFTMERVRSGWYWANFQTIEPDDDYDKLKRVVCDTQPLVCVGYCDRHAPLVRDCDEDHKVHYEQVWTVSVDGEDYLADKDGKYILTADGKRICFKSSKAEEIDDMGKVRLTTLTGEQFKQLIEGNNPNGDIDTIPEMMRAAQGISDDTTVKEEIESEVAESDVERVTPEDLAGFEV